MKNSKANKKKFFNNKIAVRASLVGLLVVIACCAGVMIATNGDDMPEPAPMPAEKNMATWKEVPIRQNGTTASGLSSPFDLKSIITGRTQEGYALNTFVFRGTIIGMKEYEISWIDENGEQRGPYKQSILEVKNNKEYHGKSPVDGDVIRVLYPYSLSWDFDGSVRIIEGDEYVFINNWVLDEKYIDYISRYNPDSLNYGATKRADIVSGGPWDSILAVDNDKVILRHEYFDHDDNAKAKIISSESVKTDMLASAELLRNGGFIALNLADFEESILHLFENPDKLPTIKNQRQANGE